MNKIELSAALKLAEDKNFRMIDNEGRHLVDIGIFDGFGLPNFKPVVCTLSQVAALIRWQCFQFNGEIDGKALNEIAEAGRRRFQIVG